VTLPAAGATWKVVRSIWQHPSNRGQRVRRLLLTARFQFAGRFLAKPTVVRYGRSTRMTCILDGTSSRNAVYFAVPDWPEMLVWRAALRPGSLFVDAGANVGLYTLWAADCGATVEAVEPGPDTARQLRANLALNDCRAAVHEFLLADREGEAYLTGGDPNRRALSASPTPDATPALMRTLESLVGDRVVDGLKVDVEGAERLVVEGGERLFAERRVRLAQFEWNSQSLSLLEEDRRPLADLLVRHGYELLRPDGSGVLRPLVDLGFGRDVFARPAAAGGGARG
jgi:FkbM family methyltransferase